MAAKRRHVLIGLVLFVGAFIVAGIVADVKPATFFTNLWRFTDYLGRIFTLEQGPMPAASCSSTWSSGCGASTSG